MKNLLPWDFIPFGFQYYRAPTPHSDKWAADLKKVKQDGFSVVKFWVQWRWNEPKRKRFFFQDIDRLMSLAAENGLKVVLNLILDAAPAWLYRQYPDCRMETASGERLGPTVISCRQTGGVPGPCFHHGAGTRLRQRFVAAAAKRYADHDALLCWDIWNEPELTVSLKREADAAGMVCYCTHSKKEFIQFLKRKYGTIQRLNGAWGRNYTRFSDAEPPRATGTTNDMIDWRLFFAQTVTEEARMRAQTVKRFDKTHPVMCHTVPPPIFNAVNCCADEWPLAECCDLMGNSVGSDYYAASLLFSAARGKPVINAEVHAAGGYSMHGFARPDFDAMLRHVFIPFSRGSKGFLFWQYRPEILGYESPAWGNVTLKGTNQPWHDDTVKINNFLKSIKDFARCAQPPEPDAAIFLSPENEIYLFGVDRLALYNNCLKGAFKLFNDLNYRTKFIRADDFLQGNVQTLKTVYFPSLQYADSALCGKIIQWIQNGGTAFFEPLAAAVDGESGLHAEVIPGGGLSEALGIRATNFNSAEMLKNAYGSDRIVSAQNEFALHAFGEVFYGDTFMVTHEITSKAAQCIAEFSDGSPAAIVSRVGDGQAITFGAYVSSAYLNRDENRRLIARYAVADKSARWGHLPSGVIVSELHADGASLAVIENTLSTPVPLGKLDGYADVFATLQDGQDTMLAPGKITVLYRNRVAADGG